MESLKNPLVATYGLMKNAVNRRIKIWSPKKMTFDLMIVLSISWSYFRSHEKKKLLIPWSFHNFNHYITQVVQHGVARDFYYQLSLFMFSLSISVCLSLSLCLSISLSLSVLLSLSLSISQYHSHSLSLSLSPSKKLLQFQVLRQNACSCGSKSAITHLLFTIFCSESTSF